MPKHIDEAARHSKRTKKVSLGKALAEMTEEEKYQEITDILYRRYDELIEFVGRADTYIWRQRFSDLIDWALIDQNIKPAIADLSRPVPRLRIQANEGRHYIVWFRRAEWDQRFRRPVPASRLAAIIKRIDEAARSSEQAEKDAIDQEFTEMAEPEKHEMATILTLPSKDRALVGVKEIAINIRNFEDQAHVAPPRAALRRALSKIAADADLLVMVLEENERSAAIDHGGASATVDGSSAMSNKQGLRASVDQWIARNLAIIDSGLQHKRDALELYHKIGLVLIACDNLLPALYKRITIEKDVVERASAPIQLPLDPGVAQVVRNLNAQWVAREGLLYSSKGMRALATGVREYINCYLKPHRGSDTAADASGVPRARHFCAIAATDLFQTFRGWKPGHSNQEVQRLCTLMWDLAGCARIPGQESIDNNDDAWGRHLRLTRKGRDGAWLESRILVNGILARNQ